MTFSRIASGKQIRIHVYRPWALVGMFATCIAVAWGTAIFVSLLGAMIDANYYPMVLWWSGDMPLLQGIIAQGLFESTIAGAVLGLVYVLVVGLRTNAECPWKLATVHLLRWAMVIPACWAAGGVIGLSLFLWSPGQILHVISINTPHIVGLDRGEQMRFVWVGGTIDGAYIGSLLAMILACVTIKPVWRRFRLKAGRDRRGWSVACGSCGYSLRKLKAGTCPECGRKDH